MKNTKEWFSRFHPLGVRRQSTVLLVANLFFKTICRNRRIESRRKAKVVATGLVAFDMMASVAFGAQSIWVGTTSSDWFTGSNWLNGVTPTANDTAVLRTISPFPAVVDRPGAVANQLTVGQLGVGALTIQSGGLVTDSNGNIGFNGGSAGTVTVNGTNSTWTNTGNLFIGGSNGGPGGTGLLEIINSGTVNATAVTIWKTGTLAVDANFTLNTPSLTVDGGTIRTLANTTFPNSATLVAGGVILDSNGFDSTFSGEFSGPGGLTKISPGTVILTGFNTYSGGTTISAGTLELGDFSFFPGGPILAGGNIFGNVTDNGTLAFNRSRLTIGNLFTTHTFAGVISGTGSVVQLGSDTLVLTANNTYSGGTTIQDGTLVAGTPSAAQKISNALGMGNVFLQGFGTLATPSSGLLFAFNVGGNHALTINVGGNYAQGPKGTLALGVAGVEGANYDHVQVGGNASLNGFLSVNFLNNFAPVAGNAFEVLRTNGSRSGQFAQVNDFLNNIPNLQRVDVYAPNGVALVYVAATTPPPPTSARPPIDVEEPNPLPPVDPEKPLPLSFLLKVLNPTVEQLTSMFEIPFSGANTQRFNLNDRMAQIQRGSTGFVSPLPTPPPTGKETIGKALPRVFQPTPENRWGVWVNGWGDWVSVDSDNGIKGYDFTTGGVSGGVDYRITDCLAVGLFGTYAHTWTSLNPGSVDANTGRGGLYATYWNQGFYVNGGIYGGHNSYDTSRQTLLRGQFANGSTSGYEFSTFVDTGYDFRFGNLSIGPVFAAQYTNVHIDSYTERASFFPLNIQSDSEESWRTDLGIQASYTWHVGQITVIPSLWAAWEHEYKYSALPITANFPGVTATTFGPDEGHDSFIINAGAGVQWTPRISTYVGYQGELDRSNYSANGVTGTISFSF